MMLLDEALKSARIRAQCLESGETLQKGFYAWINADSKDADRIVSFEQELISLISSGGRTIQAVSALGFLFAMCERPEAGTVFKMGVEWIIGRTPTAESIRTIVSEPLVQLGILIGLQKLSQVLTTNEYREWRLRVPQIDVAVTQNLWRNDVSRVHSAWLGAKNQEFLFEINSSVALSLHCKGVISTSGIVEVQDLADKVLMRLLLQDYLESEEIAIDLFAYEKFIATTAFVRVGMISVDDLSNVLARIPAALRRWTWENETRVKGQEIQKWKILHEYHFQNLLTFLLVPLFPDLRDEEWLSSVGQKKPRADLVIPSLHAVIEVKYWRIGVKATQMISEIAEDTSLYLKNGSPYKYIIPVIWDQGARVEEHRLLINGLSELSGVRGATVTPAPAFMRN